MRLSRFSDVTSLDLIPILKCLLALSFLAAVLAAGLETVAVQAAGASHSVVNRAPERPSWTVSRVSGSPEPAPPYRVEPAFPRLKFSQPLDLSAAPGSDRLFVAEQGGKIFSFVNQPDVADSQLVVDLKKLNSKLTALYAITFHPQFAVNRKVYVCYIEGNDRPDGSCVSEFLMSTAEPPVIDPASERQIIRWWSGGHNGCSLKFGPDGYLYISTGDGGAPSPPDPLLAGQDVSNLLSNILRIDVDHQEADKGYRVPADNPYVSMPGVRPEIWAFGFRNPWRMSFDRERGDLWVGDVGWQLWEMVYLVKRGGNYGWPIMEGPQPALPESRRGPAPILPPVISHPHSEAASVTGGFVYYGQRLPELRGAYIYGDYQTGKVWGLRYDGKQVTWKQELAQTPLQLVSFGEDNAGEIYLVDHQRSHTIHHLVASPDEGQHAAFPRMLSDTGVFASTADQQPSAGVIEYQINAKHWADHSVSQRWMALPGSEPVQINSDTRWEFPEGSVIVKTISMDMTAGDPATSRRLETQLLHREDGTWRPYTYAWNDAQTDAELVPSSGFTRVLRIQDASVAGGVREQTWRFAARGECQMCHNPWAEAKAASIGRQSAAPLAISTMQLNRAMEPTSSENQLEQLRLAGWISGKLPDSLKDAVRFVDPYDTSAELEARARSYLHVNCAHCHQEHAGGSALIRLTMDVELPETKLINAKPGQGSFGISQARLLSPGDPHGSVLYYRMARIGSGRMPRAGSEEVDEAAVRMIYQWISTMPRPDAASDIVDRDLDSAQLQQLVSGTSTERMEIVRHLTSTTRRALGLLSWLQNDTVSAELRAEIVAQTQQGSTPEIRELFERFVPASARSKRLGATVNASELLAMEADVERGRQIFLSDGTTSCKSCHRAGNVGESLGPDLSQIGSKYSPAELLTHLLEPSRFIDEKFVTYLIETKSGMVHNGLLQSRSETEVVLKDAQRKEVRIPASEIEAVVSQQKSLMPELLLKDMTPQQAADLIAYLSSLRQPMEATLPQRDR